ncbi:MAG: HlyC/CorC family transporter [Gammaproteobacteria bacterium]|nr:HlyC/CorC family transporter [Gammaproteobacteria bacterium]
METSSVIFLTLGVVGLIACSAFFSAAETSMMALNRYRLRHLADQKHAGARRAIKLLQKPDGLIGFILLGNNFLNVVLTQITTLVTLQVFGESGLLLAGVIVTALILIFAEVLPKTIAALHPERLAFPATLILIPLMTLFRPVVATINAITRVLLSACNISADRSQLDPLDREELRTVVKEAGAMIPQKHRDMLFGILDLEKVTVEDIMIPRGDVVAIDFNQDWDDIREQIMTCRHTRVPCYRGSLDNVIGILHMRSLARLWRQGDDFDREQLEGLLVEPYYVPLKADLHTQLINFQLAKQRVALVVDEYGDITGIVTIDDVLEQVVGEFTTVPQFNSREVFPQQDGSVLVDAAANIRELNRAFGWDLPEDGPKTLNGLILKALENIPDTGTSFRIGEYTIEIVQSSGHTVRNARIFPPANAAPPLVQ